MTSALEYAHQHAEQFRRELHDLLRIPSVSTDMNYAGDGSRRQCLRKRLGKRPIFERAGGSIPITYTFQKVADEVVIMGFGYKTGQAHGPNENAYVHSLHRGIDTAIYFLQAIGGQD